MSVLRIEHLNKSFGSLVVTDDFNLVLPGASATSSSVRTAPARPA